MNSERIPLEKGGHKGRAEYKAANMPKALAMRIAGHSYREIGYVLDRNGSTIRKWVSEMLEQASKETMEKASELVTLEMERLDQLQASLYAKTIDQSVDLDSRLKALDRIIRIMERRARLLGLDQPQKQVLEHKTPEPIQFVEVTDETDTGNESI